MSESRIRGIEGMRGIAALYVAVGHVATMTDPYGKWRTAEPETALTWITRPLWFGHLAVAAFIVISGFCLQWALSARGQDVVRSIPDYLRRRCRRILPPYYACLVLSLLTCYLATRHQTGMPWEQYLPVTTDNVLAHFALIHNWRADWMYKINGVLWSIAIEFQIYFLFPAFVQATARRLGVWLLAGLAGLSWLILAQIPGTEKLYIWYVPLFGLGMVAAKVASQPREGRIPFGWLGSVAFVLACWLASAQKSLIPSDIAIGCAAAAWMAAVITAPAGWLARVVGSAPIVWLGTFSYSLYLMHHPILQWMYVTRPSGIQTPGMAFGYMATAGIACALIGCYLFFLVFERPFMSGARRAKVESTA